MLIQAQFKSRFKDEYGGKEYTYRCDFPVQVGDLVEVPVSTQAGEVEKTVRVSAVDVPDFTVSAEAFERMKSVIRFAKYEETLFDNDAPAEAQEVPALNLADNIIVIKQLPVIENQLRELRSTVEGKVNEALSLAVTEETVKAVKVVRAALNKEYAELESRRKQVKDAISKPYNEFEATYKEIIGNLYTDADRQLKEKIDSVENGIKNEKREALRKYYEEYRAAVSLHNEEIAAFDKWNVNVTKTASDKSLRQAAKAYLDMIRGDLDAISTMQDADEVLVEYKACMTLYKAVATVQERHKLAEEARRRRAEAEAERAAREAREKEAIAKVEAAATVEPMAPPVAEEKPQPEAPQQPEKVFPRFTFTVINATKSQLIKVREFMKQEGIQYE